jgi:hypothetical protein
VQDFGQKRILLYQGGPQQGYAHVS